MKKTNHQAPSTCNQVRWGDIKRMEVFVYVFRGGRHLVYLPQARKMEWLVLVNDEPTV